MMYGSIPPLPRVEFSETRTEPMEPVTGKRCYLCVQRQAAIRTPRSNVPVCGVCKDSVAIAPIVRPAWM